MKQLKLAALLVTVTLLAISTGATESPGISPRELKEAKKLYLGKCAKCHELHSPAAYTPMQWNDWLVKMSRTSRLNPEQEKMLKRYTELLREMAARNSGQTNSIPK